MKTKHPKTRKHETRAQEIHPKKAKSDKVEMTPGKSTQEQALEKVRWLKEGGAKGVVPRHISVDGGISAAGRDGGTARMASEAGANVLVSGSFVFGHPGGCAEGVKAMLEAVAAPC